MQRWTYLRDLRPEAVAEEAALNVAAHVESLARDGLGLSLPSPAIERTPTYRVVRALVRYAQGDGEWPPERAEAAVRAYLALLRAQVRGAARQLTASYYRRPDPLLGDADLRTHARGPLPEDAFPEMAQVLLAAKARIHLSQGQPVALRELAALASRPVNALRRDVQKGTDAVRRRDGLMVVSAAVARAFLRDAGVPGF